MTIDMLPVEGRKIGEDFKVEPTSFDLVTPLGAMGPWLASGNRAGDAFALHVSFNQAHQQSFGFDFTGSAEASKLDLRVSRALPSDVGVKPDMFGSTPADIVKIDATLHADRKAENWSANGSLLVDGAHVQSAKAGAPPVAAQIGADGAIAGASGAPLDVTHGRISFGAGDAPLTGSVTILDNAIVAKLAAPVVVKCDDGATRDALAIALDTRDIGAATIAPSRLCAARAK